MNTSKLIGRKSHQCLSVTRMYQLPRSAQQRSATVDLHPATQTFMRNCLNGAHLLERGRAASLPPGCKITHVAVLREEISAEQRELLRGYLPAETTMTLVRCPRRSPPSLFQFLRHFPTPQSRPRNFSSVETFVVHGTDPALSELRARNDAEENDPSASSRRR
jgi:hypothetical protein